MTRKLCVTHVMIQLITAGTNIVNTSNAPDAVGYPTGGSRDIQWGWAPVGGASNFDAALTPNYLVATTFVGTVTVTVT
jgi:hypothetical protein